MRKIIFILLTILLTYSACDTNDTPIMEDYSELYGSLKKDFESWDAYSGEEKTAYLSESYYLGYIPTDLALLGFLTENKSYFQHVNDIISIYKKNFVVNGMLRPKSLEGLTWYRDQFARDNRYLYEAYVYTGNSDILKLVEQQVSLWIEKVPRAEHDGYLLFPYGISGDGSIMSYEIDPNQNLQVATLFSYLYWEPNSKYYKNQLFKEIAFNEVNAVIALQKENGSLPIREYLPLVEDSNYGGYSGDLLYHLSQIWGEHKWIESTIRIGEWLHRDFSENHPWNTPEDGVNFRTKNFNSFNLIARILPFYAAGVSRSEISKWIEYIKQSFPNDELNMGTRWYFYQSIPRSYLMEKKIPQNLTPYIYGDNIDKGIISIRVVGETIKYIELIVNDKDGVNIYDERFGDEISFGKSVLVSEGSYVYKVVVSGNDNKMYSAEESFTVNQKENVCFYFTIFDTKNTFKDIVNN